MLALALVVLGACATDQPPPREALKLEGLSMGTSYRVTVPGADAKSESEVDSHVRRELQRVDALMSTYRTDSELSRFNRHASTDPYRLSDDTFSVLALALATSEVTGGAFDITVGPLVDAWGFGPHGETDPPSDAALSELLNNTGWRKLALSEEHQSAIKETSELQCDLSAIAKGYAVDRVAAALEALGYDDYLVEVGGEVRAGGNSPSGKPWRLGVERPDASGRLVQRILHLSETGVATSGDYRNFRQVGGERFGHILDPRTGRPATSKVASATVLDPSAARADAFATAMLVLGEADGIAMAEEHDLSVLLVVRDGKGGLREVPSSRFRATMSQTWP